MDILPMKPDSTLVVNVPRHNATGNYYYDNPTQSGMVGSRCNMQPYLINDHLTGRGIYGTYFTLTGSCPSGNMASFWYGHPKHLDMNYSGRAIIGGNWSIGSETVGVLDSYLEARPLNLHPYRSGRGIYGFRWLDQIFAGVCASRWSLSPLNASTGSGRPELGGRYNAAPNNNAVCTIRMGSPTTIDIAFSGRFNPTVK